MAAAGLPTEEMPTATREVSERQALMDTLARMQAQQDQASVTMASVVNQLAHLAQFAQGQSEQSRQTQQHLKKSLVETLGKVVTTFDGTGFLNWKFKTSSSIKGESAALHAKLIENECADDEVDDANWDVDLKAQNAQLYTVLVQRANDAALDIIRNVRQENGV